MRAMRRVLAVVVLLGLVVSGAAFANHFDPKQKLTKADKARAKAMVLRKADLGPGWAVSRSQGGDPHLTCKALDQSDLTVSGEAESPDWSQGLSFVTSVAAVYKSRAQANTAWKRSTSSKGLRCLRSEFKKEFGPLGLKLLSLKKLSFPKVAQRTAAYRLTLSGNIQGQVVRIFADFIVLQQSRAQTGIVIGAAFTAPRKADEVALAKTIAKRMAKAMRGA